MENKKLAFGMLFIVFLMLFVSYAGITTGTFWNNPLSNTLKGLFVGFGVLVTPFIITAVLVKRTSIYVTMLIAVGVELVLAVVIAAVGYMEYSKVFIEAVIIGLPAGVLIAWVANQKEFGAEKGT